MSTLMIILFGILPVGVFAQDTAPAAVDGPRDLLRLYGIDESMLDRPIDGRPVGGDDNETLLKLLFRMRDFPKTDLKRWARPKPVLAELLRDSKTMRGEIFLLSGSVTEVKVCRPLQELVERFGFDRYYRCEFLLGENRQPAVVFTRNVPKAWRNGGPVDQPAGAYGVLLKLAGDDKHPVPVFVAQRVAWYSDTLLSKLGMDVGLLDDLKDRKRLTGHDREAFYQMLDAVGRAKPGELLREAKKQLRRADKNSKRTDKNGKTHYSVVPLFNMADTQRGRLVSLAGTARRVLKVHLNDPDIVERFGIDHYYNLYVYTDDSQSNPIVFCVRDLPLGMPTGDGPQYGEYVEVAGFFFKSWAYRTSSVADGSGRRKQLAPLIIGRQPVWFPRETPADNALIGAIAGVLFVVVLFGIWFTLWRYSRGDKQFHDRVLVKTHEPAPGISLDDVIPEVDDKPDFSGL